MNKYIAALFIAFLSLACGAEKLSPYVGEENRKIKSLSRAEVDGYLSGKGMGFAKVAELNGYPGPKHVLDLSKELNLTAKQISKSKDLFDAMQSEAKILGADLVEKEKQLDQLFSNGNVDHRKLEISLASIGQTSAKLRQSHLAAHLEQKKVLSPHQVSLYIRHRGYNGSHDNHDEHSHH